MSVRYITYAHCSPEIFRVGQIVEVQVSFIGYRLGSGHWVFMASLGEVVFLDRGCVLVSSCNIYTMTYTMQELQVKRLAEHAGNEGSLQINGMPRKQKSSYSESAAIRNVRERMDVTSLDGKGT